MSDQATTADPEPRPQDDGPAILEARKVTRRFGGLVAVNEVDLIVGPAQIVGLIGPNGAGKTTFFNCITGLFAPSEGDVLLEGKRINGLPPDRITKLGIARTFQNLRLFSNMSARENVLVGRHCRTREGVISAVVRGPRFRREEGRASSGRPSCWSSSAWPARARSWPATCPTATCAGWRSPVPWPPSPSWSCWTSPPPA